MLKVKNLSVEQPSLCLENVSFQAGRGEIVGVVGPNTAGKSLLLDALAGYLPQSEGHVILNHFDLLKEPEKAKIHLGFLPDPPLLEDYLSGYEFLHALGSFYHLLPQQREKQILEASHALKADSCLYELIHRLSPADRQKIGLLASFFHQPDLIIWDEPTANLDFLSKATLGSLAMKLAGEGKTFVIATNDLAWLEPILTTVVVLSHGKQLSFGTIKELARQYNIRTASLAELLCKIVSTQ